MEYGRMIISSLVLGTIVRFWMLRIDYRQYPGYPHGYVVHLALGFIAAGLGGLVLPALLEGDYVAITFLSLAAQQFSNIRSMERDFLTELEKTELVPRGSAYIEGISKVFEARNYLAMLVALVTTVGVRLSTWYGGVIAGLIVALILERVMSEKSIKDIAKVDVVELKFSGPNGANITIDDVVIMNVGLNESLKHWKEGGIGITIDPLDDNARATLINIGQRQAILHDVITQLGVKLDQGVQDYTPLARLNLDTGRVCIIIVPIEPDEKWIKEAVENTPILESSKRRPLASKAGQGAAD
ncbi:MAG: YIEGIA family protein [Bacillota bacterium]